ncbi:hypothetical protein BDFB_012101 [Asbolus verrucosus]|uniref:Deltamethrin resistance protein prag01 domain-containing protein n=1 Tax=Asbolus verrucosus TaxID=1661398 RepID=A0A482VND9_ASBVE|nr:hypothetical protein BDFB_012101 [Asbolus verrucosus]
MNDLPSPEGDWYTLSNKQQSKYNVHLVLGIGSFIATLAFGFATDQFESFNDIPEEPAEIDCYK